MLKYVFLFSGILTLMASCQSSSTNEASSDPKQQAKNSILIPDSSGVDYTLIKERITTIQAALAKPVPILTLPGLNGDAALAQDIAQTDVRFCENLFDKKTHQAYRNEIFNVYAARPQETPPGGGHYYKVEMYNYALNLTTSALVELNSKKVTQVNTLPQSQPDIPLHLKNLATQIAIHHPEVIKALGFKPGEEDALMASTKTALNNTRCERSMHLCVAPTFTKGDKALWAIVDLTDHRLVGLRWTNTGPEQIAHKISEKRLKFDKVMECYCKQISKIEKQDWKLNYIITTSDGLRISEVTYKNNLVLNNAKIVDWHVNYSNTDHFGYSDAVGCPEYSQAAVVAVSDPRVSDIIENGQTIGFALEQNFSSEQWPLPCNYNYLQRFEFYKDGRFRCAGASLGRGCGNNGTYRPVFRIAFAGNQNSFSEWNGSQWTSWNQEQWKLQTLNPSYTPEGYLYKVQSNSGQGFYIEPAHGQFHDGGRGDNPYLYLTKLHAEKDEGENDLVTIGPCCNTNYEQGPEKFIDATPEATSNTSLVLWYVCQMKNDDTPGKEYCWSESYLENGVYKTRVYPCIGGPMFIPIKK